MVAKGEGGREQKDREFGNSRGKVLHRVDKPQGPTVKHRELYSISYNKP